MDKEKRKILNTMLKFFEEKDMPTVTKKDIHI